MNAKQILTEANLHKSYWGKIIIAAEKRERFTDVSKRQSQDWTVCACGELDKKIPRRYTSAYVEANAPIDRQLFSLGVTFMTAVENDKFTLAAKRLTRIENRAKKILAKL